MKLLNICNKVIEYSFYALFFLVPLVFTSNTSELFEFNKMWLTFGLTIIIGASWFSKMLLQKKIFVQRTPLDIPIVLFLLSQVLSTIFSQDPHVSLWGYYSRWNGGLLSIISYVFLYYAFVSNLFSKTIVYRLLAISLTSGLIVALWGLPSHFGYDPTCLLFRRTFDVSCWTENFQPKIRIFSTLGQPNWLSAYLAVLIPISIAFAIKNPKSETLISKQNQMTKIQNQKFSNLFGIWNFKFVAFFLVTLFYLDFLFAGSRSGFIALWLSLLFSAGLFIWIYKRELPAFFQPKNTRWGLLILVALLIGLTFFVGTSIVQLDKFTFPGIKESFSKKQTMTAKHAKEVGLPAKALATAGELGGTDSGKIRTLLVWQGAINAWKHHPIFGTGVETFAFAYYKYKPQAHNLVSEWDYLYNKAHNEYLNYLATTGTFGLGTYLFMIGAFIFLSLSIRKTRKNSESQNYQGIRKSDRSDSLIFRRSDQPSFLSVLKIALLASYISILVTNFFGFSVVIVNIYLFLIPAFVFALTDRLNPQKIFVFPKPNEQAKNVSGKQRIASAFLILATLYLILTLIRYWLADKNYAYGYNLNRAGNYQEAYPYLHKAVSERSGEPVFQDEMAVNDATLAVGLLLQKTATEEAQIKSLAESLVKEALETNNQITSSYPNNVLFQKSRTRIFYLLSQVDARYLPLALTAIAKASNLAPNDAKISYNWGVLQGQNNQLDEAIQTLQNTLKLKRDYTDAYYALGLFYHQKAIDKNGKVVDFALQEKAIETMQFILDHLQSNNGGAKQALAAWEK